ncbi:MAG: CDP-alcohol phosphatidyltransferase family protein [Magnetococcales bacterium]|nr:CDP-alcohol phosphatidyltransferase family protein [Magnetococcales bacterium]
MKKKHGPLLTPNQITTLRLFLTVALFTAWFLTDYTIARWLICAGFIFIFAADAWDGVVARRHNLSTMFGIYFDPVVDQISYTALTILMIDAGLIPLWFLFVFVVVSALAAFIKNYAAANNRVISASILAKVKADLVSVPLAGLYFMQEVSGEWGIACLVAIGMYWFLFKFMFDPSREHTIAMRASLVTLAVVFLLRPDSMGLAEYYGVVYVILALVAHTGSAAFYWWDNRDLFHELGSGAESGQALKEPVAINAALDPMDPLLDPVVSHQAGNVGVMTANPVSAMVPGQSMGAIPNSMAGDSVDAKPGAL